MNKYHTETKQLPDNFSCTISNYFYACSVYVVLVITRVTSGSTLWRWIHKYDMGIVNVTSYINARTGQHKDNNAPYAGAQMWRTKNETGGQCFDIWPINKLCGPLCPQSFSPITSERRKNAIPKVFPPEQVKEEKCEKLANQFTGGGRSRRNAAAEPGCVKQMQKTSSLTASLYDRTWNSQCFHIHISNTNYLYINPSTHTRCIYQCLLKAACSLLWNDTLILKTLYFYY